VAYGIASNIEPRSFCIVKKGFWGIVYQYTEKQRGVIGHGGGFFVVYRRRTA